MSNTAIRTGRWTEEEHATFLAQLRDAGKDWKRIAAAIPSRTIVQIRTHAQKYFMKLEKQENKSVAVTTSTSSSPTLTPPGTATRAGARRHRETEATAAAAVKRVRPGSFAHVKGGALHPPGAGSDASGSTNHSIDGPAMTDANSVAASEPTSHAVSPRLREGSVARSTAMWHPAVVTTSAGAGPVSTENWQQHPLPPRPLAGAHSIAHARPPRPVRRDLAFRGRALSESWVSTAGLAEQTTVTTGQQSFKHRAPDAGQGPARARATSLSLAAELRLHSHDHNDVADNFYGFAFTSPSLLAFDEDLGGDVSDGVESVLHSPRYANAPGTSDAAIAPSLLHQASATSHAPLLDVAPLLHSSPMASALPPASPLAAAAAGEAYISDDDLSHSISEDQMASAVLGDDGRESPALPTVYERL